MGVDPLDDILGAVVRPESWTSPEAVSARKLNQQVAVLRRLLTVMGWDQNTFRDGDPKRFPFPLRLGAVETAGPNGTADYTDERYWIREKIIPGTDSPWDRVAPQTLPDFTIADPVGGEDVTISPLYTVTNVLEIPDHTHTLKEGTPVLFLGLHDTGQGADTIPATRYVMAIGGGASILFGKMVGGWTPGSNAVTLTPCKGAADNTPTGAADITAYIQFPISAPAPSFAGGAGDILGYMSIGAGSYVLVGAPVLPRAGGAFQILANQGGSTSNWQPDHVRAAP